MFVIFVLMSVWNHNLYKLDPKEGIQLSTQHFKLKHNFIRDLFIQGLRSRVFKMFYVV